MIEMSLSQSQFNFRIICISTSSLSIQKNDLSNVIAVKSSQRNFFFKFISKLCIKRSKTNPAICKFCLADNPEIYSYILIGRCGESFFTNHLLKRHIERRHCDTKFACDICGKLFLGADDLKFHQKIHKEPTLPCSFKGCEKMFNAVSFSFN